MTESDFLAKFKDSIGAPKRIEIGMDTVLNTINVWDSLAIVATIALFDIEFDVLLSAEKIQSAKTVRDLWILRNPS